MLHDIYGELIKVCGGFFGEHYAKGSGGGGFISHAHDLASVKLCR